MKFTILTLLLSTSAFAETTKTDLRVQELGCEKCRDGVKFTVSADTQLINHCPALIVDEGEILNLVKMRPDECSYQGANGGSADIRPL